MFLKKQKKTRICKGNRILITVNFPGSAGPMRFVVYETEIAATVIDTALRSYAREGRLPILRSTADNFVLYCTAAGSDTKTVSQWEAIGAHGGRNFVLCKKMEKEGGTSPATEAKKGSGCWNSWINKLLLFKISIPVSRWKAIGAHGGRSFVLCKKMEKEGGTSPATEAKKGSGCWNSWINKLLLFKISIRAKE